MVTRMENPAADAQAAAAQADAVYVDAYQKAVAKHAAADQAVRSDSEHFDMTNQTAAAAAALAEQAAIVEQTAAAQAEEAVDVSYVYTLETNESELSAAGTYEDLFHGTDEEHLARMLEQGYQCLTDTQQDITRATSNLVDMQLHHQAAIVSKLHLLSFTVPVAVVSVFLYRAMHCTPVTPEPPVSVVSEVHTTTSALSHMAHKTAESLAVGALWWVAWYVLDCLADGNSFA